MSLRVALLTMSPWQATGGFMPFSLAVWRLKATLLRDRPDCEVRIFDANDWSMERWAEEIESFNPDIIGASVYVWSFPSFAQLARQLRRKDRWIVFGGPSARVEMLLLPPYQDAPDWLDAFCFVEGESVITPLIDSWPDRSALASLTGLASWDGARWKHNPRPASLALDAIASPYQMGLIAPGSTGQLETYRGCPMRCSFCQWGVLPPSQEHATRDHLIAELRAIKALDPNGIFIVDAGLNLHAGAFSALYEAEQEVGCIAGQEFAVEVYPTRLKPEHLALLDSARSFVGIGLQSIDRDSMNSIGRPYTTANFHRAIEQLSEVAMTTIEIIVGLPHETPEQFWETFEYVMALPVSVRVFQSLILPDAALMEATRGGIHFDPHSLRMISSPTWDAETYARTLKEVHQRAMAVRGSFSLSWPLPASPDDDESPLGRPLGGPMWTLPDEPHEVFHRHRVR